MTRADIRALRLLASFPSATTDSQLVAALVADGIRPSQLTCSFDELRAEARRIREHLQDRLSEADVAAPPGWSDGPA